MSTPSLEALAERILSGGAPLQVRSAAARGALPLSRTSLARLYLHLQGDTEPQIRQDAVTSLQALTAADIREVLGDPACAAEVLAHFAPRAARDESIDASTQDEHQSQRQHRAAKQNGAAEPAESRAQRFAVAEGVGRRPPAAARRWHPRLRLCARAVAYDPWGGSRRVHRSHEASSMIHRTSALKLIPR